MNERRVEKIPRWYFGQFIRTSRFRGLIFSSGFARGIDNTFGSPEIVARKAGLMLRSLSGRKAWLIDRSPPSSLAESMRRIGRSIDKIPALPRGSREIGRLEHPFPWLDGTPKCIRVDENVSRILSKQTMAVHRVVAAADRTDWRRPRRPD